LEELSEQEKLLLEEDMGAQADALSPLTVLGSV
jgi:hypothetical protein